MTIFFETFLGASLALWLRDYVHGGMAYVRKHNAECKKKAAEFSVRMRDASDAGYDTAKTYEEQYRFYSTELPFKFLGRLSDVFQSQAEPENDPEHLAKQWRALLENEKREYKSRFREWQRDEAGGKPYREWTPEEKKRWDAHAEMYGLERIHEAARMFTRDAEVARRRECWLAAGADWKHLWTVSELNSWSEEKQA